MLTYTSVCVIFISVESKTITQKESKMEKQIKIKRDGVEITLKIEKYQGNYALAYGSDNKQYLRKGRGMWKPAYLTVR